MPRATLAISLLYGPNATVYGHKAAGSRALRRLGREPRPFTVVGGTQCGSYDICFGCATDNTCVNLMHPNGVYYVYGLAGFAPSVVCAELASVLGPLNSVDCRCWMGFKGSSL